MAIDNTTINEFGKGVIYAAPIDLNAKKPLDSRIYVDTRLERDAHYSAKRCYPGMLVYVAEDSCTYIYAGEEPTSDPDIKEPVWGILADRAWVTEQIVESGGMTPEAVRALVETILEEKKASGEFDDIRTFPYGPRGEYTITNEEEPFPAEGNEAYLYVDVTGGHTYKWDGTDYVEATQDDYKEYFPLLGVPDVQYVDKYQDVEYMWINEGLGGQYKQVNKIASTEDINDLFN